MKLVLTRHVQSLRIDFADPKNSQGTQHVAVPLIGERKDSALAIENPTYADCAALFLAQDHPDGRRFPATLEGALNENLLPDGSGLKVAGRAAACSERDA